MWVEVVKSAQMVLSLDPMKHPGRKLQIVKLAL